MIGAINGAGSASERRCCCRWTSAFASEKARIGFVYARRGIVYECCSSWFLPRVVGIAKALEWSF